MTAPFSPDERQALVLEHGSGTLLVTGPSGTGKTAVLRERFARLIEQGADPDRVALVVGSSSARETARAALLQRLPTSLSGLQVVTMHGLANRILKARAEIRGNEPPQLLSATEQFAKVQELLASQELGEWPAYGQLLGMRGFVDEVRQFLSRSQEALLTPGRIMEAADRRGLTGWHELARFLGEYQEVLDALNLADFASLLQRAAGEATEGEPPFDHVLVDDYHDTTLAAEAILLGLRAPDLVVAADPDAHVFSFQGTSRVPLDRFIEVFGGDHVELVTNHRAPEPVAIDAWVAPHPSEEHAAIARELRRLHVEEGVDWNDMAVVVRRQGTHLGGLLRALDDARIPRAMPERGLSLTAEPATRPYVLALRWLVAEDTVEREALIEQLLVSDVVGLSPAAARALLRASRAKTGSIANALDVTEGLTPAEAEAVVVARETLSRAALFAGMSVQDAFRRLWEELPCSRRLVDRAGESAEARRELDTVVTFANLVAETDESSGDPSVVAFLESLDAGEHGPGYSAWERGRVDAVHVLTAHGAVGREFDTVLVTGVTEGNFPSLSRPEPMFDLAVLERPVTNADRNRERLDDERRLFDMVKARARRRVVLTCADIHAHDERSARSRFVEGSAWAPAPSGPFDDPVSTREAAATWRSQLADRALEPWKRIAALDGLVALGVDARRWWFQRDWTDTGRPLHEEIRVSYSRLSNLEACELMHVLGDELGLGRPGGYHAWVGKTVHSILEQAEKGEIPKEPRALVEALDRRWRDQEFPSMAVSRAFYTLAHDHMLRNWFDNYAGRPAAAIERFFEFEFEGATVIGYIDRIGPAVQDGYVITDFKTGKSDSAGPPRDSLQLGIYYLAVQESPDLAEFQPVKTVELAFLRGNWRSPDIDYRKWMVTERDEEAYQTEMKERLATLIARKRELNELGVFRPNPYANCRFCDFQSLCPLYPEGQPVFSVESVRQGVPA